MELIVPDDHLSLAIGRRGQNVRLAAQLTGWKIDIHSETRIREMNENARSELALITGLGDDHRELLIRYGFRTIEDVADAELDDLMDTLAIEEQLAETIVDQADVILTERMREKIARDEENVRRVAAGLPTLEEEEAAAHAATEEAAAERAAEEERLALEAQVAAVAAKLSGLKALEPETETPEPTDEVDPEAETVLQEPEAPAETEE